ncbi:hypothetical protein ASPWEDRAFT_29803 [Aspergillus wentii DTO 134E9]|uniref:Cytochrome P450 n=1 Tax=Aspergillus wentii DTO 134E9 TaxID=1073089 RepID=A0A1L9RCJ2_ASPWE|nr:uncharacterized protein ASPWEDRAFT_29803 [Aspergillus wentii DTO 134E9]OJJ32645.1 hypothetical protein ASPWEDRAFT_29803 [Aspergillus wentii DTO 134E9]
MIQRSFPTGFLSLVLATPLRFTPDANCPGHAAGFFKDYNALVECGRKYCGYTNEPFAVTIAGQIMYIITAPRDLTGVYKNTATISIDSVSKGMYRWMGVSEESADNMFVANPLSKYNRLSNTRPLNATDIIIELHRQQGQPGGQLEPLFEKRIKPGIYKNLNLDSHPAVMSKSKEWMTVSLFEWCNHVFIRGTTEAYFGDIIWEIKPDLTRWCLAWERTNWKYMFQLPAFLSQDMLEAKRELIDTFFKFAQFPKEQKSQQSFFVEELEQLLRATKLSEKEVAGMIALHYWVVFANVYKVAFWIVAHLVRDPALLESIRSEILPSVNGKNVDEEYLADKCPKLDSLWSEVLRMTLGSALVRDIVSPTIVAGKTLHEGNKLMVPYRHLHVNTDVWGPTPTVIQPERFLHDKTLKSNASYRPWGGGNTLCPGRFFSRRYVFMFIALLLSRYDVRLEKYVDAKGSSLPFPRANFTKPSPGAVDVQEGDDAILSLRRR